MRAALLNEVAALVAPEKGTVWIGPFEQLVGAGYALLAAGERGIESRSRRNYHEAVRRPLIPKIMRFLNGEMADDTVTSWLAGFYFNAAKQRIVWTGERLLRTLGSLPCPDGDLPPQYTLRRADRPKILEAATIALTHLETHRVYLPQTRRVALAHEEGKLFHLLNSGVNLRKHAVYPDPLHVQDAQRPERKDLGLARDGFGLLVASYLELLGWAPDATRPK